jgi:hypothetical protein
LGGEQLEQPRPLEPRERRVAGSERHGAEL